MRSLLSLIMLLTLIVTGCSSVKSNPIQSDNGNVIINCNLPVGISSRFPDGSPSEGFGVMGLFTLDINPVESTAELNPVRKTTLTDTLEVIDITNFLSVSPCTDCAKIHSVSLDAEGNLVVSIGIKHPFDIGNPSAPISGKNRADLHVFNVEGILAVQDDNTTFFPALEKTTAETRLLNASGYTPYLDVVLDEFFKTAADIHPYILYFSDYSSGNFDASNPMGFESVTSPPPSGNLVMAMGCDYGYRDYVIDLPDTPMAFIYAIGCTYAVSCTHYLQRFEPEYRVPQHLKKAASEINVIPPVDKLKENDPSAEVTLQVEVLDLSHGVDVGDKLNEMLADSSVDSVAIEIPGVLASPHSQTGSEAISGTGHNPADPLVYEFIFHNEESAVEGIYPGLVKVTDSYPSGLNESVSLEGKDGIKRVDPSASPFTGLFDIDEFASYAVFNIEVEYVHTGNNPVACIEASYPPACAPLDANLDASCSTDIEDDLVDLKFEFDYDYDGINFTVDRPIDSDPTATAHFDTKGCYVVAVRVTDTDLDTDIATTTIPVGGFEPDPAGEADITDGISITDIDFMRGLPPAFPNPDQCGIGYAAKNAAEADGYLYCVFYGKQSGINSIFFIRSEDDGVTWSVPVSLHDYDSVGEYGGCTIAADESGQVIIGWADFLHRDFFIEYSFDNGDTFTSKEICNYEDVHDGWYESHCYRMPDVAIDPSDPENILLSVLDVNIHFHNGHYYSTFTQNTNIPVYYSSDGPDGTFNEVICVTSSSLRPAWPSNVRSAQINYAADSDGYLILGENKYNFVFRSSDCGATWPDDSNHRFALVDLEEPGGYREMDAAFDPNDPDVFYVVRVCRAPWNDKFPIQLFKSTDGITLTQIHSRVNDNDGDFIHNLNPSITVNDAGVLYVVWQSDQTGKWEILADYSCDSGATFGTDITVNNDSAGYKIDVEAISNPCGDGVICIWEQNGDSPDGKLVFRSG